MKNPEGESLLKFSFLNKATSLRVFLTVFFSMIGSHGSCCLCLQDIFSFAGGAIKYFTLWGRGWSIEYCMFDRGPGFLGVGWFGSNPPLTLLSVSSTGYVQANWERGGIEGAGGGGGAKSYNSEKAWSSINQSILPGIEVCGEYVRNGLWC